GARTSISVGLLDSRDRTASECARARRRSVCIDGRRMVALELGCNRAGERAAGTFRVFARGHICNHAEAAFSRLGTPGYGRTQLAPALGGASPYTEFNAERCFRPIAIRGQCLAEEVPILGHNA